MREEFFSMYACICTTAAGCFYWLAQYGTQGLVQQFLYAYGVLLYLPAMVGSAVIGQFNKITLICAHNGKVNNLPPMPGS